MCEFCDPNVDRYIVYVGGLSMKILPNDGEVEVGTRTGSWKIPISFCPLCGRELEKEEI
jgi:hypothetical protein